MTNTSPENQEAKRRADLDIRGTAERLRADRSSLAEWAGCESPRWRALLALLDGLDGTIVQNGPQFSVRTPDAVFTERFQQSLSEERIPVTVNAHFDQPREDGGWKAQVVFGGEQVDAEIVQVAHELLSDNGQSALARTLLSDSAQEQRGGALKVTLGGNVSDPATGGRFDQGAVRLQLAGWLYCCQALLEPSSILPAVLNLPGDRTLQLQDRHVGAARTFGVHLLSSMALEMALKLGTEQDTGAPAPQGHDLAKLAGELSLSRQAEMESYFDEYLREHNRDPQKVADVLDRERNTFVEWRYVSELDPRWQATGRTSTETDAVLLYGVALAAMMSCFENPGKTSSQV